MRYKKYLFLASLNYAFPIMRPLQDAIRRRGGEVRSVPRQARAWGNTAGEDEVELTTVREVMEYAPTLAVFTPAITCTIYFPGVKVQLFHASI